ncbi:iron-containing alcohol dehydrogenase [Zobellella taiwanensis]|jgi:alcohol dehydrogenase|uniref:Alcohol dehydrogenase n=1 Tax=Zobellella taiwanensis TaxID=347535 RepID=A0A2P7R6I7_9GAMM|nr:iron-containing alcohol dehydrogenase [Zobellella taiwanensis]PSJ45831.1 alcohol dehydrogenase [Zobellella taiwanensis]
MQNFNFYFPTTLKSGFGLIKQSGNLLKPYVQEKLLVVTDQGLIDAGALNGFFASLEQAGVNYHVYQDVQPNPAVEVIEDAVAVLKRTGCDAIVGVGGGSSIDTAKAVAAMATNPGSILDYEGYDRLVNAPMPLFAIPTTSGTGSECTASTVVTNPANKFKTAIISPLLFPKLAILDAELTLKLPPAITASTGMDALTHAIESYVSKQANPISRALAIQAIIMIAQNLKKAYFVGTDAEARDNMLVASFLAGLAFSQSKLGNVHAISHTFGGIFNIPHGVANAALLPYVVKFNLPACPGLFRDIAVAMGENVDGLDEKAAGSKVIDAIFRLNQAIDIPLNVQELGVDLAMLPQMVEDSMRSGNVLVNPRLTRAADIERIITDAYHGKLD